MTATTTQSDLDLDGLRALLKRYKVKQLPLARRLGIPRGTLACYLTGASPMPADLPPRFHAAVLGLVEERRQAERAALEARLRELDRPVELPALEAAA